MTAMNMTVTINVCVNQSSEETTAKEKPRISMLKEKILPITIPRSDSPKGNPKGNDDIITVSDSDSESDSDDSVVFIQDVPQQTADGRSISPDFFDRETPPISPQRFTRVDARGVAPDFFDRRTPPISPQKLCRIDYMKDRLPVLCNLESSPVSPIKIRIQQCSSRTIQCQAHTIPKNLMSDNLNHPNTLSKPIPVLKHAIIRLRRVDEVILEQYKLTSEFSKCAFSQEIKNNEQTTTKSKGPCTKTVLLPLQMLNTLNQQFQQKKISSTGESSSSSSSSSSSLRDSRLIRVTMDVPYSKILDLEKDEICRKISVRSSELNKDKFENSVTLPHCSDAHENVAKSKGRKVSFSDSKKLSQNTTKYFNGKRRCDKEERKEKETDKMQPFQKTMNNTGRKERTSNLKADSSKRVRNRVKCDFCTKRVSNLVDHIIREHGTQFK